MSLENTDANLFSIDVAWRHCSRFDISDHVARRRCRNRFTFLAKLMETTASMRMPPRRPQIVKISQLGIDDSWLRSARFPGISLLFSGSGMHLKWNNDSHERLFLEGGGGGEGHSDPNWGKMCNDRKIYFNFISYGKTEESGEMHRWGNNSKNVLTKLNEWIIRIIGCNTKPN